MWSPYLMVRHCNHCYYYLASICLGCMTYRRLAFSHAALHCSIYNFKLIWALSYSQCFHNYTAITDQKNLRTNTILKSNVLILCWMKINSTCQWRSHSICLSMQTTCILLVASVNNSFVSFSFCLAVLIHLFLWEQCSVRQAWRDSRRMHPWLQ